ncbi:hypothetical protein CsSME_00012484 [Camellia sinensis var. sinensis]
MALIFLISPMLFNTLHDVDNVKMEGDNDINDDNNHVQKTSGDSEVDGMHDFVSFPAPGLQIVLGKGSAGVDAPLMTEDMHEERLNAIEALGSSFM